MTHDEIKDILKDLWCFEKSEKYSTEDIREALSFAINLVDIDKIRSEANGRRKEV